MAYLPDRLPRAGDMARYGFRRTIKIRGWISMAQSCQLGCEVFKLDVLPVLYVFGMFTHQVANEQTQAPWMRCPLMTLLSNWEGDNNLPAPSLDISTNYHCASLAGRKLKLCNGEGAGVGIVHGGADRAGHGFTTIVCVWRPLIVLGYFHNNHNDN